MSYFQRKTLANQLTKQLLTPSVTSASGSGLFLAAPRRIGKSTFLREDLRPALLQQGVLVLYADLWANKLQDPGETIVNVVRAELAKHQGVVTRLARSVGLEKLSLGGLLLNMEKVGLPAGMSLSSALAVLSDEIKTTIVLIIDEAQHALTTANGSNTLFALKAARDELNSSAHFGLRVVATGSNRDKLTMLRSGREQAFYGAPLIDFPALGEDFIEWFCRQIELPVPLDPAITFELFQRAGCRPEVLSAAADALRFDFALSATNTHPKFEAAIEAQITEAQNDIFRTLGSLTPLQRVVLTVMAEDGERFAPFEDQTMTKYKRLLKPKRSAAKGNTVSMSKDLDISNVQGALTALQEKALVWRAARGVYAIEEESIAVA
jgi:hypothetical protein